MKTATLAQSVQVLDLVRAKETSLEKLQTTLESGLLSDLLDADVAEVDRDKFRAFLGLSPVKFTTTVDCGMTLEQMIAAGNYDWVNPDITPERFPIKGTTRREEEPELVHFNRDISSDDAIAELDKRNMEPADIVDLLAFGAKYPDIQRKFPVVALGSVAGVHGYRAVACLGRSGAGRGLSLYWFGGGWSGHCRFLARRKRSVS